jgi:hypothetical protein
MIQSTTWRARVRVIEEPDLMVRALQRGGSKRDFLKGVKALIMDVCG